MHWQERLDDITFFESFPAHLFKPRVDNAVPNQAIANAIFQYVETTLITAEDIYVQNQDESSWCPIIKFIPTGVRVDAAGTAGA